jgi:hypothetical protein
MQDTIAGRAGKAKGHLAPVLSRCRSNAFPLPSSAVQMPTSQYRKPTSCHSHPSANDGQDDHWVHLSITYHLVDYKRLTYDLHHHCLGTASAVSRVKMRQPLHSLCFQQVTAYPVAKPLVLLGQSTPS